MLKGLPSKEKTSVTTSQAACQKGSRTHQDDVAQIEPVLLEPEGGLEPVRQGIFEEQNFPVEGFAVAPQKRESLRKRSAEQAELWEQLGIEAHLRLENPLEKNSLHLK